MVSIVFAPVRVNRHTEENKVLTMKQEFANGAVASSQQVNIQKQKPVVGVAETSSVGIKTIRKIGRADVYNMEVQDNHNFAVAGGLIVHNCMDASRYFVKTIGIVKKARRQPYNSIFEADAQRRAHLW